MKLIIIFTFTVNKFKCIALMEFLKKLIKLQILINLFPQNLTLSLWYSNPMNVIYQLINLQKLKYIYYINILGIYFVNRITLQLMPNFIPGPSGSFIKSYVYIDFLQQIILYPTGTSFSQLYIYDINTLQNIAQISGAFSSNQIGDILDITYDIDSSQFMYLDTYGNFYVYDLYSNYPVQNIFKISEIFDRNETLVGYSYDRVNNNVLVFSTNTIYQIDYSISGVEYVSQLNEANQLFAAIPISNQQIDYLIFNDDNVIFRYSQSFIKFEFELNNSQIKDIKYYSNTDTLVIGLSDQILLYQQYQQYKLKNQIANIQQIKSVSFYKFIIENIVLTYDKKIIHFDILTSKVLHTIQFNSSQFVTSYQINQSQNILVVGFSNGQVLQYNLLDQSLQFYQIQNSDLINNSIIKIIICESQQLSQQVYAVSNGGVLLVIDLSNKNLIQEVNLITLVNEDSQQILQSFSFDSTYLRYLFAFRGQKKAYVWNITNKQIEKYLIQTNQEDNQIRLTQKFIITSCISQLNIYCLSSRISLITVIKRNLVDDQIVDYTVVNDYIIAIFFIGKYEVFLIQGSTSLLISQQFYNYPRMLGYIYDFSNNFLKIYGLHQTGVFENNYSLDIYVSQNINDCSILISSNELEQIKLLVSSITPKQQIIYTKYGSQTVNQNDWSNQIYLQIPGNYLKNVYQYAYQTNNNISKFLVSPFDSQQNNLNFYNDTFSQFYLQVLELSGFQIILQNETFQNIDIVQNQITKQVIFQNVNISSQCIDTNQIQISNVQKVIFQNIQIQQLKLCNSTYQQQKSSLFYFYNISEIFIYNLNVFKINLTSLSYVSLFSFTNVDSIMLDDINIFSNTNLQLLSSFQQINTINISNLQIISNLIDNQNKILDNISLIMFFGCQKIAITNSLIQSNSQLPIIYSFSNFTQNDQQIILISDEISFSQVQIQLNKLPQQQIILLQSSFVQITNLIYQQNYGSFQIKSSKQAKIQVSNFTQNQAQDGGAIYFKNILNKIEIVQSFFMENSALGSGGALIFENINSCYLLFDKITQISKNKALIGGGLRIIQTDGNQLKIPQQFPFYKNVFQNKADLYGNDSATYLQNISVENFNDQATQNGYYFALNQNSSIIPTDLQKNYQKFINIKNFQSGGNLQLKIFILDNYQRYFSFSKDDLQQNMYPDSIGQEIQNIQIQVEALNQDKTQLIGEKIINYIQYNQVSQCFELTSLQILGIINTYQYFSISFNINQNSIDKYQILVSIDFRKCIKGEIVQQISKYIMVCKSCLLGTYQLIDPTTLYQQSLNDPNIKNECKNCPASALTCQGSNIQLKNGFWRQNNLTDQIIPCDSSIGQCQAQNPQSINYCIQGYIGPICQQCDILGEVWNGNRYTQSLTKGVCKICDTLAIQWLYIIVKQFKHVQTCYYLRAMKILPISRNSIRDYSGFYIKILISYYQISSLIIPQPKAIPINLNVLGDIVGETGRQLSLGIDCIFGAHVIKSTSYILFKSLTQFLLPLILLITVPAIIKIQQEFTNITPKIYHYFTFLQINFIFFQISQIAYFSKALTCVQIGDQQYNSIDLSVPCKDKTTSQFLYLFSLLVLCFWTLYPLIFLWLIYRKQQKLNECITIYSYGYYYSELKNQLYYWEFVRIYLKIITIYIYSFLFNNTVSLWTITIMFSYYCRVISYKNPFISINLQKSEKAAFTLMIIKIYLYILQTYYSNLQIAIEITQIAIDYFFFFYHFVLVVIFKVTNQQSILGKGLRFIFKILLSKQLFEKISQYHTINFKTYIRWKFINKNIKFLLKSKINPKQKANSKQLKDTQQTPIKKSEIMFFKNKYSSKDKSFIIGTPLNQSRQNFLRLQHEQSSLNQTQMQISQKSSIHKDFI
ncbi:transmembrane protein, putative (macronuclear) [Tetrahymena thermophila SB210]|uniref:Transmembrane protein, putative n=1 Tax=Tetrahymena thermophila (strain SB210) TaxID=312017 RepID=Q22B12_TETTS|nr:transmembrane protein, putative [Tetrahymena thermophila SB210]EAR82496.2 transmembrane protein, putative [Tetrahymena thermophila SB210]|eukprot:XP_001030159.2 transmembrane protein, putative [Tetrahymena thermophila SB210]